MSRVVANPRSALHAQAPIGIGTPDVESLLSYFCRLAVSHSVSVPSLARTVAQAMGSELREHFEWHERNLSGIGDVAQSWAGALSAMTSVGNLDQLTLVRWRDVVAQTGLAARTDRWCPECFAEDLAGGNTPYFRLAWEIAPVLVCHKHKVCLTDICPDCGTVGVRHKAAYVVPGWCTQCGGFLGKEKPGAGNEPVVATSESLWTARQIGALLSGQSALRSMPDRMNLQQAIRELVERLDHGKSAVFARRIGVTKGTVHHWLKDGGIPRLDASLRIAGHIGLPLDKLLVGDTKGWEPPAELPQLSLPLDSPYDRKREERQVLDWESIQLKLDAFIAQPSAISVAEAARRLNLEPRQLYLRANKKARILGDRWKTQQKRLGDVRHAEARTVVEAACRQVLAEGKGISFREIEARVPKPILSSVEGLFDMLQEIKMNLGVL